ncbi:MAG: translation initiation factor IF-2 [Candidatus Micrarchaeota archaeon]
MTVRSPIVCVLGHVDHGKTSLLDRIRGSAIAAIEAGAITQHVGASFIPAKTIKEKCGELLDKYKIKLTIPGLLFIDTPGHEAFTSLRKRGGSIADLAVLVIDIKQGIQPQTKEAIEILRMYKTPFVIAANKVDLIDGWQHDEKHEFLSDSISRQRDFVKERLDEKIYEIIGQLGSENLNSDRYDRVEDMTKHIVIIPTSAKKGEGISELLVILSGLAQKFMAHRLETENEKPAEGTVLEAKETAGLGMTIDAIIDNGCIKVGDKIAVAGKQGVIITKIRALLQPQPLEEIRDPKKKFKNIDKVYAAAGIKIAAPGLEEAIAGSPLLVVEDEEKAIEAIENELKSIRIETENDGAIIKTDALGSVEAIANLFAKKNIPVRRADVGVVTKKDVIEAEGVKIKNRYAGVIFAFNTAVKEDAETEANSAGIKIFKSDIIYVLEEEYAKWAQGEKKREKEEQLVSYVYPAKMHILPGCIFRMSKPAIVGVEILGGTLKPKYPIMNEKGEDIGRIESIQDKNESIDKAEKGRQVAISIDGATVGRGLEEGSILYTSVPVDQIYKLRDIVKGDVLELLEEIRSIKKR